MSAQKNTKTLQTIDRDVIEILEREYAQSCEKAFLKSRQSFFEKAESINGLLVILCVFFWTQKLIQEFISDRFAINVYVLIAMSVTSMFFYVGLLHGLLDNLFEIFWFRKFNSNPIQRELNELDIDDRIELVNEKLQKHLALNHKTEKNHE